MFNIIVNFELKKTIRIKKIGLTFRKLTQGEKNIIKEQIDNVYKKNKKVIDQAVKTYKEDEHLKLSMNLLSYDEVTRGIIVFCFMLIKKGFSINSKTKIDKMLNRTIIISYDLKIMEEYINKESINKMISNILSLYGIYSKNIEFNYKVRSDYEYILSNNILNIKEKDYFINLILDMLVSYKSKDGIRKNVELSEDYLLQLKTFFEQLDKNEIRRFFTAIDMIYSKHNLIQNSIINNVTIIESILISEDREIKRNFVLKAGILLNSYIDKNYKKNTKQTNKFTKDCLEYAYDIRSSIVHGNQEKILNIVDTYCKKNKYINELINSCKDEKYNTRKDKALNVASSISYLAVRATIKCWLEKPSIINYLKEN